MADKKFEIVEDLCILSEGKGRTKELNLVSWEGGEPLFDLREWDPKRSKAGAGLTLTQKEAERLYEALEEVLWG